MNDDELNKWITRFETAIRYEDSIHEAITSTGDVARNFVEAYKR